MYAEVRSAVLLGAQGHPIRVEVHVGKGLPGFGIVGLPDASVRESRDRVRAAILSTGFPFPDIRITVNLAPSQERKSGSGLDLAIAVGVLAAAGHLPREEVERLAFVGEVGLDGSLRPVPGIAPMIGALGDGDVVVPAGSAAEAAIVATGAVRPVGHLVELIDTLAHGAPWPLHDQPASPPPPAEEPDLADVCGQGVARTALEVAAIGGHHLLFVGPPGAGKTMLARRLPGLLPRLDRQQALEATMVHSAAGVPLPAGGLVVRAPFRAPHHTSSQVSLIGGGSHAMRPGEISLASGGVLFLDELPEFPPHVLEALRQPLESGSVHVARARLSVVMPADFQLVAAMNPCPCGGGPPGGCRCGDDRAQRYLRRVSGPLLDRFDLRVGVNRPSVDEFLLPSGGESTAVVAARVADARRRASTRQGCLNAKLPARQLDELAPLTPAAAALLRDELEAGRLSGRGYRRVRRVALSIADRDGGTSAVSGDHVATAIRLRRALDVHLGTGAVA